jgi:hypothetical protein
MSRRIAQLGVAAALAATAFLPSSASGYAIPKCVENLDPYAVNAPGFVTCEKDVAASLVVRVGACTGGYQPLGAPFGSQVVPQTQAYADCLA